MGTRTKCELDRLLQDVLLLSKQHCSDNTLRASTSLEDALSNAISATKNVDPTARLSLEDLYVSDLLKIIDTILSNGENSALLRSKLNLLLFNLALFNLELRQYMAVQLSMCASAYVCLKQSIQDELGPQNLIDILRLIQVLTYEKKLPLGTWTNDCITFLLGEICNTEEPEWLSNCCAILCNIVSRSKTVCIRIKKAVLYKLFQKRMVELLAHDSRTVVVSVLVIIGYLDEKLRDTVFCTSNIPQTFQCLFNVLDQSDGLMTRHIGCDLLRRLVVAENPTGLGGSVLTTTGKDLVHLSFFERSIQKVASLFLYLDPRTEESAKVYELLLAFCSIPTLRTPVCSAILSSPISASRAATPFWAIAKAAKMNLTEAISFDVPMRACHLLRLLLKEVFDSGKKIRDFMQLSAISEIVTNCADVLQTFDGPLLAGRCQLLIEGLRIADVAAVDDDLRAELLVTISSSVCAKILNDQFVGNSVVHQLSAPQSSTEEVPGWCVHGTEVVLELTKTLATLKDFSKLHKDLYWRTLKDERLIPFIAFAITDGNCEMVSTALLLYSHCKQVPEFQTSWLGGLIASCTKSNRDAHAEQKGLNGSCSSNLNESFGSRVHIGGDDLGSLQIDELLTKVKQGTEAKDSRLSLITSAFEQKMSIMEGRERELERLLVVRTRALEQSEKMLSMFKSTSQSAEPNVPKALETNLELGRQRNTELKLANEKMEKLLSSLQAELRLSHQENEALRSEKVDLMELLETQQTENTEERKMHSILREKFDDMAAKFTLTSKTLFEAEDQVKRLTTQLGQLGDLTKNDQEASKKLKAEILTQEKQIVDLEIELEKAKKNNTKLESSLKDEMIKSSELHTNLSNKDTHIRKLEEEIALLNSELEKLKDEQKKNAALKQQMMAMMNNM